VADITITDVSALIFEMRDAVFAVSILRAIKTSAAHHGGQPGDGNSIELMVHDVVYALLLVRYLVSQAHNQPFGNLAQEDAALGARIEKARVGTLEQFLRQHVQHLVGQLRRGEHFVVAQVGQARQHIGIVV
jgi:hypothetical protein